MFKLIFNILEYTNRKHEKSIYCIFDKLNI